MSRLSEARRPARAIATAIAAAMLAMAGTVVSAQESQSASSIKNMGAAAATKDSGAAKPAANAKDAAAQATTASRGGSAGGRKPVMRCWQEGKLLFEGAGMTPAAIGQATIELRNGSGVALQVFDLKNALCLLDYSD
jgi:hypothetical protein